MPQKTDVNIFIASSGELEDDRKEILAYLHRINKDFEHLHLIPRLWEHELNAGSVEEGSSRIQDDINKWLDKCDITIVLVYSKLGDFTKEEYELSREHKKKVYVFFKKGFEVNTLEENDSYRKVLEFRELIEEQGDLQYLNYKEWSELKGYLSDNLSQYLKQRKPTGKPDQSTTKT